MDINIVKQKQEVVKSFRPIKCPKCLTGVMFLEADQEITCVCCGFNRPYVNPLPKVLESEIK